MVEKDFLSYLGPDGKDWGGPVDSRGRQMQRGNGGRWLCANCNSFLGREYVRSYTDFVRSLVQGERGDDGAVAITAPLLRVFKQVVAMFVAINSHGPEWPSVLRFVRDPTERNLPTGYRVFMFRCAGPSLHLYGFQHKFELNRPGVGLKTISEITHPPIGFHLLHAYEGDHDRRMVEITDWQAFDLNDTHNARVVLPTLQVFSPMFDDFRTPEEMRHQRAQSESRETLKGMGWWLPDA